MERSSIPGAWERMRRCGEEGHNNEGHQRRHSLHELVRVENCNADAVTCIGPIGESPSERG